ENGANSSFVNRLVDEDVPAEMVVACPFDMMDQPPGPFEPVVTAGPDLFAPERPNSVGYDLSDVTDLTRIDAARTPPEQWQVGPILAGPVSGGNPEAAHNPATGARIGTVQAASVEDVQTALGAAQPWQAPAQIRAEVLNRAADLYEADFGKVFALLATEAGKTLADAVAELREAVDFLRYYAAGATALTDPARGLFTCISPWNFPLAIFTGQVAAALAAGNAVLAKPAETTPAIAAWGIDLLHKAGVPRSALQLLPGAGGVIGTALTSDPRIKGVAFTGSTATARRIAATMAAHLDPGTPLIAETGGLNAMIVDSTALPEQAVRDIVASAFQSAGQRCSALRCLYVQQDIAPALREMLIGAMEQMSLGDPWQLETDIGPVITDTARNDITAYIDRAADKGRVLHRLSTPQTGTFVAPALIAVDGIADLGSEVFGPVLHFATFRARDLDRVIDDVNATGYGLTFGLHTRIDDRVQTVADRVQAGNIYTNRNQIGAIVGSQPFGGEGLSGTGPKAGGPHYLPRFTSGAAPVAGQAEAGDADPAKIAQAIAAAAKLPVSPRTRLLPGPTGELNRLTTLPRPPVLCLGPGEAVRQAQVQRVQTLGGHPVAVQGHLAPEALIDLPAFGGVIWWGAPETARAYAQALTRRVGPIIGLVTGQPDAAHVLIERHLCVDTTAAGGNASLLAGG
uniref:L-glutamate gamma-semialdehyde dehydrogenase n=1 Tax=Actibacterium sp. TaxID=1872125 RepID=UPI0035682C96